MHHWPQHRPQSQKSKVNAWNQRANIPCHLTESAHLPARRSSWISSPTTRFVVFAPSAATFPPTTPAGLFIRWILNICVWHIGLPDKRACRRKRRHSTRAAATHLRREADVSKLPPAYVRKEGERTITHTILISQGGRQDSCGIQPRGRLHAASGPGSAWWTRCDVTDQQHQPTNRTS